MKKMILLATAIVVALPAMAHAQQAAKSNWASVYAQMYTGLSDVSDPGSNSRWRFDDNVFGLGASIQRRFGGSIGIGLDGAIARPKYEREDLDTEALVGSGTASVATLMLTGRYGAGGGPIGFYLTGGVGTIAYSLDDLDDGWNADFALQAGTGLEYRFRDNMALGLEWGRMWGYHEKEDIGGGSQKHSRLSLGLRYGF